MKQGFLAICSLFIMHGLVGQTFEWANSYGSQVNLQDFGNAVVADKAGYQYFTGRFGDSLIFANDTVYTFQKFGNSAYFFKQSPQGKPLWIRTFKGPSTTGEGLGAALDAYGNVYFTGSFRDTAIFAQTDTLIATSQKDIFLAKYYTSGSFKWAISESGNNDDIGYGVTTYDSFVYFGGEKSNGGAFLAKYDSSGTSKWKKTGGRGEIQDLNTDSSGDLYVTGSSVVSGIN
ncbi:MAG: hypothetical protein BRD49_06075 [Bacteroidetes bacterium SW_10_40_5]|nr:MAG: hypothetical protein BRD49_06075 [Bacteroidetes bacterium SW_10_40_5]